MKFMLLSLISVIIVAFSNSFSSAVTIETEVTQLVTKIAYLMDTSVDKDGKYYYYIAKGTNGQGIFKVDSSTKEVTELYSGSPFVWPISIYYNDDDQKIYVADPYAANGGALFVYYNGVITTYAEGYHPYGCQYANSMIYFTGYKMNGNKKTCGLYYWKDNASKLFASIPCKKTPISIAYKSDGTFYVSLYTKSNKSKYYAKIVKITKEGYVSYLTKEYQVGYPPGIALTADEKQILLSGAGKTAQIYVFDLSNGKLIGTSNNGISGMKGAGGLHQAKGLDTFGWAGSPYAKRLIGPPGGRRMLSGVEVFDNDEEMNEDDDRDLSVEIEVDILHIIKIKIKF